MKLKREQNLEIKSAATKSARNLIATGILVAGSAASMVVPQVASAAGSLSIYHWFEYIPQELLDKFAKENDVKVTMDTFDSNESMLAALKAGKLGSYDVAVPGDYMVEIMRNEGMLDSFESSELSNFGLSLIHI